MSLSGQAPLRSSPSKCRTASTDRRGDAEVFTFAGKCVEYDQYDHDRSVASCGRNATGLGPRHRGLTGRDRIAPETLDVCVCVCVRACVCVYWEQRVTGVLVNEDPRPQPRANVPACIRHGPQRGHLGDTLIFIFSFIFISLHAVPFPVSGTARA